jgi:hypothetical protein
LTKAFFRFDAAQLIREGDMSKKGSKEVTSSREKPRKLWVRLMLLPVITLLVWAVFLTSVYVLVACFAWRWPYAVILSSLASGTLLLVGPWLADVVLRQLRLLQASAASVITSRR